jgi:hypothetical protein
MLSVPFLIRESDSILVSNGGGKQPVIKTCNLMINILAPIFKVPLYMQWIDYFDDLVTM